jgi:L-seryl-tRNA(Ser) seleniumtransferase
LLRSAEGAALLADHPRDVVVDALRATLAEFRAAMLDGEDPPDAAALLAASKSRLREVFSATLRPVINATGVILHTNLGRAPLSAAALDAMARVSGGYSSLEYDLDVGERGSRHGHVSALLRRLTGAEAALVVNNNASTVFLALTALAHGREVIISRGQLVEIGGGFRIPDILRQSGARLVEVGTTNRTYIGDYEAALTEDTALILRVHASNFRVVGFVHGTPLGELVGLAGSRELRVIDDLGSGSLVPTERFGLAHEPMVQESVDAGADLVCFSGDKLLGGPQAGIAVGKSDAIGLLRQHPLMRALRPDKATIAGLHATLLHYMRGEAEREVPVWRMIATPLDDIERRARDIVSASGLAAARVVASHATTGGGSLPGEVLPSRAVGLQSGGMPAQELAARLRGWERPIVGRIVEDRVLLDLRTVAPDDDTEIVSAIRGLAVTPIA